MKKVYYGFQHKQNRMGEFYFLEHTQTHITPNLEKGKKELLRDEVDSLENITIWKLERLT